jgi:uncharacterized protein (DUF2062 family)/SAM-dependent methyltransferase
MMLGWRHRLRQTFYDLRLEGEGRGREAAALGLGLFIGCTPFYGFHLLLCWLAGWLLRLNRLKLYLAANISNPLFSPFLIFAELQTGAWARRHDLHDLTLQTLRTTSPWTFGADILIGSAIVGAALGLSVAAATLATGGMRRDDPALALLWHRASDPYLTAGIMPWEFARGKLRGDPVYRALLRPGVMTSGAALVDLGCGTGLTFSMLREAARLRADGVAIPPVAPFGRCIGVELRQRAARIARQALGTTVEIVAGDARTFALPASSTILLLDVLHMMSRSDQEALLGRAAAALEPGGAVIIREADAAAGARFFMVRAGNRLKALVTGNWRQRFAFRSHEDWTALLQRLGLRVEAQQAGQGTPFANLLVIGRRPRGSAPDDRAGSNDSVGRLLEPGVVVALGVPVAVEVVPALRPGADALRDLVGDPLRRDRNPLVLGHAGRDGDWRPHPGAEPPRSAALDRRHRHRRAGQGRDQHRRAQEPGAPPEQRHRDAVASHVAIDEHRHEAVARERRPDLERRVERLPHFDRLDAHPTANLVTDAVDGLVGFPHGDYGERQVQGARHQQAARLPVAEVSGDEQGPAAAAI